MRRPDHSERRGLIVCLRYHRGIRTQHAFLRKWVTAMIDETESQDSQEDSDLDDDVLESMKSHLDHETIGPGGLVEPFDPEHIDVQTKTPTVSLMLDRLRRGSLDLQPDFQRLSGLWTQRNQSRLIESLLLRIPLPSFYAAVDADDSWAMVDGVQRMTAIARFIEPSALGEAPLTLRGLEYLKMFEGVSFANLPGKLQTRLLESEIVLHVIRPGTPDPVKFNIFARINTGGLPLTSQEIRHALIPGKCRELLATLAMSPEFKIATAKSINQRRMMDREMILRFIAFSLSDPMAFNETDFDSFLRQTMRKINSLDTVAITNLEMSFYAAMESSYAIFGSQAFRRRESSDRRSSINKALFEAIAVNLANLTREDRTRLEQHAKLVDQRLVEILGEFRFAASIQQGTSSPANVRIRFGRVRDLFQSILTI